MRWSSKPTLSDRSPQRQPLPTAERFRSITLADNSVLSNGPDSQLALQQFQFDVSTLQGDMLASLRKGTLSIVSGAIAHTSPGAMKIVTPTATLAVRGTTFVVEVH